MKNSYNSFTMKLRFEWDQAKNLANQRKHGLSFEEAAEAFRDPFLLMAQDRIVDGECRWQAYGLHPWFGACHGGPHNAGRRRHGNHSHHFGEICHNSRKAAL